MNDALAVVGALVAAIILVLFAINGIRWIIL